jgi:hypothetical protein
MSDYVDPYDETAFDWKYEGGTVRRNSDQKLDRLVFGWCREENFVASDWLTGCTNEERL